MIVKKWWIPVLFLLLLPFSSFAQIETDTTRMRNPEHASIADQLVQDLTTRLTLTAEQGEEIKEILIDYQENISTKSAESAEPDQMNDEFDQDTETETDIETEEQPEIEEQPESEMDQDAVDPSTEFQGSPQETANQAIEDVLNDTQKTTWTVIKDAWWRDVNSRYNWETDSHEIK